MTKTQYKAFVKSAEKNGYSLVNRKSNIQNEDFYYYKGFAYDDKGRPGYQILFLVWDREPFHDLPAHYAVGVSPMIITESHDWSRIDLQITESNFDIKKVEDYAHNFYFNFVLVNGL